MRESKKDRRGSPNEVAGCPVSIPKDRSALAMHAKSPETTEGTRVRRNVVFAFELLDEEVNEAVIEVFNSKVGITHGGFDLENAVLSSQKVPPPRSKIRTFRSPVTFLSMP